MSLVKMKVLIKVLLDKVEMGGIETMIGFFLFYYLFLGLFYKFTTPLHEGAPGLAWPLSYEETVMHGVHEYIPNMTLIFN